jgi:hypothetical protein
MVKNILLIFSVFWKEYLQSIIQDLDKKINE